MIALRLLLGKTGAPSCTYENKCCATQHDENERLRELVLDLEARLVVALAAPSQTEAKLQRALDENALQLMLIEQLQAQLTSRTTLNSVFQPADTALLERVSHLEAKLADTEEKLTRSVEAHTKARAHITALQHQRQQLVLELEQVEDGFQAEVEKLSGDLRNWKQDFAIDCDTIEEDDVPTLLQPPSPSTDSNPQTPIQTRESRSSSIASTESPHGVLLADSLERTKTATRIWALEDEVERVRGERDALRRRLGAGRASLIQLKQQASEVRLGGKSIGGKSMINLGRGLKSESQLGLGWGAATLGRKTDREGRKLSAKASNIQLNTFVLPPMRGEPLSPETSDDSASLEMKM